MLNEMFLIIAKNLNDEELLQAVIDLREGNRRERNQAFTDLREKYMGKLKSLFLKHKNLTEGLNEKDQLRQFIESTFTEILLAPKNLKFDSPAAVTRYISDTLEKKVNVGTVNEALGKGAIMKDLRRYKYLVNNGIAKFYDKHKREPDFKKSRDISELASMIGTNTEKLEKIIKVIGPKTIQSMFDSIGGSDSGELLLDTLKSNEPLPDEIYKDKDILKVILKEIQRNLKPDEQRVVMEYFHPDKPNATTPRKEDIANKFDGMNLKRVKYLLDTAKDKLKKSPALRQLMYSSMVKRFIRYATQKYTFDKISSRDFEKIVQEIVNN